MTFWERLVLIWEVLGDWAEIAWRRSRGFRRWMVGQWGRTQAWPLAWITVYAAILIPLGYFVIDRPLAHWLKARIGGDFEGFWKTITHLGLAGVWMIPSGLALVGLLLAWRAAPTLDIRQRLGRLAWIPGYVFLVMAASGLTNTAIKILVGRTRPVMLFEQGIYGFEPLTRAYAFNSFPSGHSQAAFAAMMALALILPRYDAAFIFVAVLVAASRVLTTVHFFSDAVMGAWLGLVFAVLIHRALMARGIDVRIRCARDRKIAD